MKRLQNYFLVLWILLLLLLAAFNLSLVRGPVAFSFLFMDFQSPLYLWLILAGAVVAGLLRWMGYLEAQSALRRAEHQTMELKAKAFEAREAEMNQFITRLQNRIETTIRSLMEGRPASSVPSEGTERSPKETEKPQSPVGKKVEPIKV